MEDGLLVATAEQREQVRYILADDTNSLQRILRGMGTFRLGVFSLMDDVRTAVNFWPIYFYQKYLDRGGGRSVVCYRTHHPTTTIPPPAMWMPCTPMRPAPPPTLHSHAAYSTTPFVSWPTPPSAPTRPRSWT